MKRIKVRSSKRLYAVSFLFAVLVSLSLFTVPVFAVETVFTKAQALLGDAQSTILLISTPAALVGVATGAFFKKFSFGDHQKIKTGNTVLWASLGGWATINGLPLILNSIKPYIS